MTKQQFEEKVHLLYSQYAVSRNESRVGLSKQKIKQGIELSVQELEYSILYDVLNQCDVDMGFYVQPVTSGNDYWVELRTYDDTFDVTYIVDHDFYLGSEYIEIMDNLYQGMLTAKNKKQEIERGKP